MILRQSLIKAFDCTHYFKENYLNPTPPPNNSTILYSGTLYHRIMERYNDYLQAHRADSDYEQLMTICDEVWAENTLLPFSEYEAFRKVLITFGERYIIDAEKIWSSEITITLDKDGNRVKEDAPEGFVSGTLDMVEVDKDTGIATIWDYKSGYYIPSDNELADDPQSKIYPYLLFCLNTGITEVHMKYLYMRWNLVKTLEFNPSMIETTREWLNRTAKHIDKRIESGEFPAIRSRNCGICNLECPLIATFPWKEDNIDIINTRETAQHAINKIEALEQEKDRLLGLVKGYTKSSDEIVYSNTGSYGYQPVETVKGLKPSTVIPVCAKHNIPFDSLLKVDTAKAKILNNPEAKEEIFKGTTKSVSSRFSFTPFKEDDNGNE